MSYRYPWGFVLLVCLSFVPEVALASSPVFPRLIAQADTQAQQLLYEGMTLFQQGSAESLQQAIRKWEQTLPLWQAVGDRLGEATTLNNIGSVYNYLGEKQKALDYSKHRTKNVGSQEKSEN